MGGGGGGAGKRMKAEVSAKLKSPVRAGEPTPVSPGLLIVPNWYLKFAG